MTASKVARGRAATTAALEAMSQALGADAVQAGPDHITAFRDPYRLRGTLVHEPAGVVYPASTEQVQEVVRIAALFGVALHTSSQGRNFGYGGAEPARDGVIALSLRRMNRILHIDPELAYAVVEPGVSFRELHEAVVASGHRLLVSSPDLSWGSVLGNALDHGIGYSPRGEHNDNLVGLEVVLPDGSLLRTGMGGLSTSTGEPSPNWHVHKRGFGPSLDGLFAQSNLGVVTRAGVWLMPEPEAYSRVMVTVPHLSDLGALVEAVRPLMLDQTIRGYPSILHGFAEVTARLPRSRWEHLSGTGTPEELAPLLAELDAGAWTLRASLYGRPDVVASDTDRVRQAFAAVPGARFTVAGYRAPYTRDTVAPPHHNGAGLPGLGFLAAYDPWGGAEQAGHVDLSPVTPMRARDALTAQQILSAGFARNGVTALSAAICRPRSIIHVNMLMYALDDAAATTAAGTAWTELSAELSGHGYGVYRAHVDYADAVSGSYDFDRHNLRRTYDRIKDALDPGGVLSPGSHGIWGISR